MDDQSGSSPPRDAGATDDPSLSDTLRDWLRGLWRWRNGENSARDTLDELIEEREEAEIPIDEDERRLLANILDLRDRTIHDVMVPRADIVAIEAGSSLADVIALITKENHSRIPVYRENLDDVVGMVHIKDVVAWRGGLLPDWSSDHLSHLVVHGMLHLLGYGLDPASMATMSARGTMTS